MKAWLERLMCMCTEAVCHRPEASSKAEAGVLPWPKDTLCDSSCAAVDVGLRGLYSVTKVSDTQL